MATATAPTTARKSRAKTVKPAETAVEPTEVATPTEPTPAPRSLVSAPISVMNALTSDVEDDMTDDTFAEYYRGQGEVRDINIGMLYKRFGGK